MNKSPSFPDRDTPLKAVPRVAISKTWDET